MADISLIRGSTPVLNFPNCDGRTQFGMPWAKRIAAEYQHSFFHLAMPLNPSLMPWQRTALGENPLAVDDHIFLMEIPQEHVLHSLFIAVDDTDPNMAGATLSPVAVLWDDVAKTWTTLTILDTLFADVDLTTASSEWKALAAPYFVAKDTYLFIALKIDTLPTDASKLISNTNATMRIVSSAEGFDSAIQL